MKWVKLIITQLVIYWTDYFSNYYKLIAVYLYKQIELERPDLKQKINFIRKLERIEGATMFFIIEKSEEITFNFSQNSVSIKQNGNTKDYKLVE